ncbi:MAG TPA: RagB/SusD family nutrient uptake outer membrane protein [Gemmatimonadales bacterium]|nr:RagB/SusD family nutrient uptake outer membrane protein [Gemmatimonadales bacterium]
MFSTRAKALGITVALAILAVGACTDPTENPVSTVTGANFFNDPTSYKEFLAKLYVGLAVGGQDGGDGSTDINQIDGGFSQYMRLYWEMEELPTDEAVIAWGDVTLPEMNTQGWTASNTFVNAMYYRVFFQVNMANQFLRETTDAKLASRGQTALEDSVHMYRAEARFLRALSYWHGIDFFGSIPLVTENDVLGVLPKQATRTQIYDFVVSELQAIKSQLPAPGPNVYGRATGPAADMLLAELYLNAGVYTGTPNYAGALSEASTVIADGYSLASNYFYNFDADNNTSPELIFSVPEDGIHTQTYGSTNFIIHASCGNSMSPASYGVDGCWYGLRMKPEAHDLYIAGDGRANNFFTTGQTVAITDLKNFGQGIPNPKFSNKTHLGANGSNISFADTDFPMFRLGEAYLIYAEAQVRGGGGDTTTALSYVNALRERAFGNTAHDVVDSQMTLPFLLAERGRELMWEAHRRTDLVRFGEFTGGTYLWAWKGSNAYYGGSVGDSTPVATPAYRDLYPLPQNVLVANPNMKQNPGY